MQVKSCVQQVWQAGPRQATTDVVGMSSIMASSSRGGEDFAACMLGAVDLPISIPLERWEVDSGTGASAEVVQSNMLRFAALADGVDSFDAAAFRLAPAEAAAMDPQQRILLEQTYGALQVQLYPNFSFIVQFLEQFMHLRSIPVSFGAANSLSTSVPPRTLIKCMCTFCQSVLKCHRPSSRKIVVENHGMVRGTFC